MRPGGMGDLIILHLAAEMLGIDPMSADWFIERRSAVWARAHGLPHTAYDEGMLRAVLRETATRPLVVNSEQRFGMSMDAAEWATGRGGVLVGFDTNRASRLATRRVGYDPLEAHELGEFMRLLSVAFERPLPDTMPAVPRRRPSGGRFVVALGGTHAPSRDLSASAWLEWIDTCIGNAPADLVYGPAEVDLARDLVALAGDRWRDRSGDFAHVLDTIAAAERVVTIDGGMVHVASYYGVPTDVLFTAGRDRKWAPLGAGSTVSFRPDLSCRPCTLFGQVPPCPIAFECTRGAHRHRAVVNAPAAFS